MVEGRITVPQIDLVPYKRLKLFPRNCGRGKMGRSIGFIDRTNGEPSIAVVSRIRGGVSDTSAKR